MSVLIAHPGSGVFVRNAVEALHAAGLLQTYATTLIDQPQLAWQHTLDRIYRLAGASGSPLWRRPAPLVPASLVRSRPWREALRTVVSRLDRSGVWTDRIWHWMTLDFDRWSASLIGTDTRAVYGYEFNALALFERAAALGIPRILELPCAEHEYISDIQDREWLRAGQMESDYARHTRTLRAARTARRRAEFALATCVIVNSQHTLQTYRLAGMRTDHFRVVPLGAEVPANAVAREFKPAPNTSLIWAGAFSVGKGALVLLEALATLAPEVQLTIDVYGSVALPEAMLAPHLVRLRIHGPVPQSALFEAFSRADALILPSLSDGWGMVVTEALAHGLPVLTTPAVGAAGLVRDGENGRVIEAGSRGELTGLLEWCVQQRALLHAMRDNARAAVVAWQWPQYRQALAHIVAEQLTSG